MAFERDERKAPKEALKGTRGFHRKDVRGEPPKIPNARGLVEARSVRPLSTNEKRG